MIAAVRLDEEGHGPALESPRRGIRHLAGYHFGWRLTDGQGASSTTPNDTGSGVGAACPIRVPVGRLSQVMLFDPMRTRFPPLRNYLRDTAERLMDEPMSEQENGLVNPP